MLLAFSEPAGVAPVMYWRAVFPGRPDQDHAVRAFVAGTPVLSLVGFSVSVGGALGTDGIRRGPPRPRLGRLVPAFLLRR
ncbi:hypothetical protein NE236_25400 [Actinoallomurus purpureus]|uniref:hypothetical protein n=1 Tax=Actinoallomurus purpureus TaxID=478114 RepID=UPI0020940223|nr:hypothetical protein [Actinoallomurus purpureus]MCO6008318.1 hypothetical protein [Actinoallomurus purpureus]